MTSASSFETRLAEADAYLKLLIDQAKVCPNGSASSAFIFCRSDFVAILLHVKHVLYALIINLSWTTV